MYLSTFTLLQYLLTKWFISTGILVIKLFIHKCIFDRYSPTQKHKCRTGPRAAEQRPELGVAVQVVVLQQVAPEALDGGPSLLQHPGQERIHGSVDSFSALFLQGVLLKRERAARQTKPNTPARELKPAFGKSRK